MSSHSQDTSAPSPSPVPEATGHDAPFIRARLVGGDIAAGYAEFEPPPHPMQLGSRWVLCHAGAFDELVSALKPFAEVADRYSENSPDYNHVHSGVGITVGQCRRARAALSKAGPQS